MNGGHRMKLYIAGKISGDPHYISKFWRAETAMEAEGYTVLNPSILPEGLSQGDYMRICLAMLDSADVAVFLSGWEGSAGACVEHDLCVKTCKPFVVWRGDMSSAQVAKAIMGVGGGA